MQKEIQKRRIIVNAIMSVAQVVVQGGILFVLYRFLLHAIGVEKLGIWAVVLATTSVANIANLGLSASVVKFVAKYLARGEEQIVANVIQTSAISIGVVVGLVLLTAYPFANRLLSLVIPAGHFQEALSILPYSLLSLWIMVIATVFRAGLDGYQRIDLTSAFLMVTAGLNLTLSFLLVPRYNLMGLAYAQVAQSSLLLMGTWVMLKRNLSLLPVIPYQWDRNLFKEMLCYGLNFQAISISQMLCDPITKALLAKFGGLTMVGFYEMANRMLMQFRMLLVAANQVLVPVISRLHEKSPGLIQKVYKDSYNLMLYLALPSYAVLLVLIPFISEIWIGRYETIFGTFSILLAVSLFINTLSVPAYFSYLGIGKLKWNTLGHVTTGVMNGVFGFILGYFYGGTAVVIAWVFSSIIGSLFIAISYHYGYKLPLMELIPRESIRVLMACLIAIFSIFVLRYKLGNSLSFLLSTTLTLFTFSIIVFFPLWQHPMRKRLMKWIASAMPG